MNLILSLLVASFSFVFQSQDAAEQNPKPRQGTYAITNAQIETVSGGTIENGTIVIRADRIVAVGTDVVVPFSIGKQTGMISACV